ncbi:MAG TPA: DUF4294 domain-containing protein [Chitinophagaceae bacterium]|nr:DUF4294 domain-containing protein [Chitinophagaceae bacterium]
MRFFLAASLFSSIQSLAQIDPPVANTDTIPPIPSISERAKNWGRNDTMIVSAIWYHNEMLPYKEMDMVWISNMSDKKLSKYIQEWNRLLNAVYVTYPYARIAGITINDINTHLANINSRSERKDYIKSREKELKAQFSDPLSNLSVYQGKVLMKLINRQTGNNCYSLIKEYRNGFTARFYQTVAFFFGSSLKQSWDLADKTDRQIENFVKEIDGVWYNNPYRR